MIYEKKSRKMDWILMEAECKKQHKGQKFQKENGGTVYPKAKTTRPP